MELHNSVEGDQWLGITVLRQCSWFTELQNWIMGLTPSVIEIHKSNMELHKSFMVLHSSWKIMNLHKLDKVTDVFS